MNCMIRWSLKLLLLFFFLTGLFMAANAGAQTKAGVSDQAVMQVIRGHIEKHSPWGVQNVRIEFLPPMPNLSDVKGLVALRVESRPREEYIGDTFFNVRALENGMFRKEGTVRVRIEVLRDHVVAVRSLERGSELSADDVRTHSRWVRKIPVNILEKTDEAIGKVLTTTLRPNSQLSKNMLRDIQPVRRGKMVRVVLNNGPMMMVMNGMAEEDGDKDAIVKIRNLTSNKVIHARVTGPSSARIDF